MYFRVLYTYILNQKKHISKYIRTNIIKYIQSHTINLLKPTGYVMHQQG